MRADSLPFRVLLLAVSGLVHREQQGVIEYLVEENRVLREQIGNRRLRLTDEQRRRLAAKGIRLGRQVLERVASIVTPHTILRSHRNLIAAKWTFAKKQAGTRRTKSCPFRSDRRGGGASGRRSPCRRVSRNGGAVGDLEFG